jgi:hypothetical protein
MELVMMHHLDYIELTCFVSLSLGVFKFLSHFAIKMIAIFAREEFSKRAFKVLRIGRMERSTSIFRGDQTKKRLTQNIDLTEIEDTARRRSRRDSEI